MVKPQHAGFDFTTLQAHLDDMAQIYAPHALQRGRPRAQPEPAPIYQLKITLRHIKPPIWRRVQVSGHITLAKLHTLIQVVMGWTDSHLHCFEVDGISYSLPNENDDLDMQDSRGVILTEVAPNESTTLWWRKCCRPTPNSGTRSASPAGAPARRRILAARGDMSDSWKSWLILKIQNMKRCWNGMGMISTPTPSIASKSTVNCGS